MYTVASSLFFCGGGGYITVCIGIILIGQIMSRESLAYVMRKSEPLMEEQVIRLA
jgi:hypothetical protein